MATVREAHPEHRVAGLQRREEHRLVGLRTGMWLHVGGVAAEDLLGAVDRDLLDDVDVLAAAVVALAGIAFGVLVGELRALGGHHRGARVVLRGDELEVIFLPLVFPRDRAEDLGVGFLEGRRAAEHGGL